MFFGTSSLQKLGGYRRFVQMYSDVVLGIEINHFEKHLERAKEKRGVKQDCAFGVFSGLNGWERTGCNQASIAILIHGAIMRSPAPLHPPRGSHCKFLSRTASCLLMTWRSW